MNNDIEKPIDNEETLILKEKLTPFLERNPNIMIEKRGEQCYIINAWNSKSVSFLVEPVEETALINTLNHLILPSRFTAIYHLDTNTMEYIFTLLENDNPYLSRRFSLNFEGKSYQCSFQNASERLLLLAKLFRLIGNMGDDRNLMLLNMYTNPDILKTLGIEEDLLKDRTPVSFFVSGFKAFDEMEIVEVSKHVNFFMQYFDRESTIIVIHPPESTEREPAKQLRFIETEFPKTISTRRKDSFLLDLTLAAKETNARLAFLYYYQVLEYAAFYYIENDIQGKMKQIICSPDLNAYPEKYISRILDTVNDIRQNEEVRLNKIVETCCVPEIVWKELQQNLPSFSNKLEFDGGFVIDPLNIEGMTLENFSSFWIPKIPDTLRRIRNALVHSRETRSGLIITPTRENELKLTPWLQLIRRIAEQILIFK